MKKVIIVAIGISIVSTFLMSCAGSAKGGKLKGQQYKCASKVHEAVTMYKEGKYSAVKRILDDVGGKCDGHPVMDTTRYYMGMAYLKTKNPIEAQVEFERLIQDYPHSPFAIEAKFRKALAVFKESNPPDRDQSKTRDAIYLLTSFIETHPNSPFADSAKVYLDSAQEKLAQKTFKNARFYEKVDEPEAAYLYYKSLLDEYPQSKYVPQALLNMAEILVELDRRNEAKDILDRLAEKNADGFIVKRAKELRAQIK
jgi:outer membrane protein assembly factor BamD